MGWSSFDPLTNPKKRTVLTRVSCPACPSARMAQLVATRPIKTMLTLTTWYQTELHANLNDQTTSFLPWPSNYPFPLSLTPSPVSRSSILLRLSFRDSHFPLHPQSVALQTWTSPQFLLILLPSASDINSAGGRSVVHIQRPTTHQCQVYCFILPL